MWQTALIEIESSVSQANFSTWFKETGILREEEGIVYLGVPNSFTQEWLHKKFHNTILKVLRTMNERVRALEYVITKENDAKREELKKKAAVMAPTMSMPLQDFYINKEDNLNPRYTFENFVVGPYNEVAHAASQMVVKTPGHVYNPLFVYGSTGRGKTHLIQAVGNRIKQLHPNKKVYYLTSERFGSEFFVAINEGKVQQFKDRYRKYDVMIMDDVQFFSNKEKFQEELFHFFNTFHDTGRQLVFSSDRHPNVIPGIEDRLRGRFSVGMIVDIPEPDQESRMAIVRSKCHTQSITLSDPVVEYVASTIEDNIREIEGIINVIACQTQLRNRELNLNEIKNILKNSAKPKKTVSIKEIVKVVSDFYNIDEDSIYNKTRRKEVVRPRQVVMYILREDFNISFPSIGDKLGGRDHTTVIHSYEKMKEEIKSDALLSQEINQLRSML
ncbi:MAG: chromosomal replication initiator protein DnaA [Patescibacteria group bacterium]|nr:chromosomal replication initiator protein DnaA [Patescibacteria group bacterium]MDE1940893.1 chromosomal replication initiator protein DnaA [Patescibacteria group bacterium]MDE1967077.1 chromosomal replication initiator protein DnaA [Patescibacteria group bacterium]